MASGTRARQRSMTLRPSSSSHSDGGLTPDSYINEQGNAAREGESRMKQDFDTTNTSDGHDQQHSIETEGDEVDPLGHGVKEALAVIGELETLGLQKHDINYPRCLVLGQQSTGKSSVIEGLSGIKTPRDTGTCTSCPLYITLQPSDNPGAGWSARVSLQQDYDLDLDLHPSRDAEQLFPGWTQAASSRHIPFAETKSRTELEVLIRRAQSANLNPLEDPRVFLKGANRPRGTQQNNFSPNIVRIDVTAPGLPTLSFYDLPGIIQQADAENEVLLVRNLVTHYVKQPGSLILVTCDLSNDIANSSAAGLAREHNATDRCIGVLTKPDLLPRGKTDDELIDVLDNRRFRLGHEYFVVKNLDKSEIAQGLTHQDARIKEREFFQTGRWATTLSQFQSRFGTLSLQTYLSKELAKQTLNELPRIYAQIEERLAAVEEELDGIPEIPSHSAVRTIADVVLSFSTNVRLEMEGEHEHTEWRNIWEGIQKTFADSLVAMKPTMSTSGDLDAGVFVYTLPGRSANESIVIDSDDEDGDGNSKMRDSPETPSKKRKLEGGTPTPSPFKTPTKPVPKPPSKTPTRPPTRRAEAARLAKATQPADFAQFRKRFILDDVVRSVNQQSKSKVPGQIHPKVKEAMMLSALQHWQRPIDVFFSSLRTALLQRTHFLLDRHFAKWAGSQLYTQTRAIVQEVLHNNLNEQHRTMAAESLTDELEGPYIFFQDAFHAEKESTHEHYRQHRQKARFRRYVEEAEEHFGRDISAPEQDKIRKDAQKMARVALEPYASEVELVAGITAYYGLAARRLHDKICMRVESKFFRQLRVQLRGELEDGLEIFHETEGLNVARRLLAESPQREVRRQELVASRDALRKGLKCLDDLRDKYQSGSSVGGGLDGAVRSTEDMEDVTTTLPRR
ncbi:dynamin family protein-like protein [Dothidotthia symphoricarpi CBS 119687]|uniref:Dynamin family protein-like protein n=1 Tax=Dothidotthia symphoricarpi CBS 119687 TaxID=1392245 RepID=A0A6A5ZYK6_9PLEO|nr:dynamin family protein-like protein [Dothidotthia symphoricarpi CBS 119687]KAF2123984.1 dynamin family protein-like protein [Dothidotthia symphoricarpi CBS 119687]